MGFKVLEKGRIVLTAPATGIRISRKSPPSVKGKFVTTVSVAPDVAGAMNLRAGDTVVFSIGTDQDAGRLALTRTSRHDPNGYALRKNGQWLTTSTQRLNLGGEFGGEFGPCMPPHEIDGVSVVVDLSDTRQHIAAE
jgi:hypothetical protein